MSASDSFDIQHRERSRSPIRSGPSAPSRHRGDAEAGAVRARRPRLAGVVQVGSLLLLGFAVGALAPSASASSISRRVTWSHPTPNRVASFVIAISNDPWNAGATRYVDAGLPPRVSESYSFDVQVDPGDYISVIAVDPSGMQSPGAPWVKVVLLPLTTPGQPTYTP